MRGKRTLRAQWKATLLSAANEVEMTNGTIVISTVVAVSHLRERCCYCIGGGGPCAAAIVADIARTRKKHGFAEKQRSSTARHSNTNRIVLINPAGFCGAISTHYSFRVEPAKYLLYYMY